MRVHAKTPFVTITSDLTLQNNANKHMLARTIKDRTTEKLGGRCNATVTISPLTAGVVARPTNATEMLFSVRKTP